MTKMMTDKQLTRAIFDRLPLPLGPLTDEEAHEMSYLLRHDAWVARRHFEGVGSREVDKLASAIVGIIGEQAAKPFEFPTFFTREELMQRIAEGDPEQFKREYLANFVPEPPERRRQ